MTPYTPSVNHIICQNNIQDSRLFIIIIYEDKAVNFFREPYGLVSFCIFSALCFEPPMNLNAAPLLTCFQIQCQWL